MNEEKNIIVKIPKFGLTNEYDEIEYKVAHLLINNILFLNNGWWFKEEGKSWPEDFVTFHVNCNDIFAWGCADSEDITYSEISDLYKMWKKDEHLGVAAWCIKKRKQMPQDPIIKYFEKDNIWNLEELIK